MKDGEQKLHNHLVVWYDIYFFFQINGLFEAKLIHFMSSKIIEVIMRSMIKKIFD
jgi:hypothetical protein